MARKIIISNTNVFKGHDIRNDYMEKWLKIINEYEKNKNIFI